MQWALFHQLQYIRPKNCPAPVPGVGGHNAADQPDRDHYLPFLWNNMVEERAEMQ